MPTKTPKDPWKLRRCKNCKLTYKPTCKDRGNAERSIFCTKKCRTAYHNGGGMNLVRFQEVVTRATIKALRTDDSFIASVSDRLWSSNMGAKMREIAKEEIQTGVSLKRD